MRGIDAFVYRGDAIPDSVLEQISISWSRLWRRASKDEAYCRRLYKEWLVLAKRLGLEVEFKEDDLLLVAFREPGKYLRPFCGRDDAARELIEASKLCLEIRTKGDFRPEDALEALYEIYSKSEDLSETTVSAGTGPNPAPPTPAAPA
jgi:hypothetical protein